MWIKALICTSDTEYANRLSNYFDDEYTNKLELNVCSSLDRALEIIKGVDIVIFGQEFEHDLESKLRLIQCPVIILSDQIYESSLDGTIQVEKYQRGDVLYKLFLECYSTAANVKKVRVEAKHDSSQKVYVFLSACGGCGSTTMARAFAQKCARDSKTLYLEFGLFSDVEIVNGAPNGMDDVLLALKSRRNILSLKLSSAVGQTKYGFYGYGSASDPMSLMEVTSNDIRDLMKELSVMTEYSRIVIDIGCSMTDRDLAILNSANSVIVVADDNEYTQKKILRLGRLLQSLEYRDDIKLLRKTVAIRNKVVNGFSDEDWKCNIPLIGYAPNITNTEFDSIVDRIASSDTFNNLEF